MRFFYDCEFIEDGRTIDLISIGIVSEDGEREYYAVASDAPWKRVRRHAWLTENVLSHLPGGYERQGIGFSPAKWRVDRTDARVKPRQCIANEVRDFLLAGEGEPELWAWYGAYDHVALAQMYGDMSRLPSGLPMWTNDLKQEALRLGNPALPEQPDGAHDALADARHNLVRWKALRELERPTVRVTFDGGAGLSIPYLASGGIVRTSKHMIGEPGPEHTDPPPGERITP